MSTGHQNRLGDSRPKNFSGILPWKISYQKQSSIKLPGVWNREAILKRRGLAGQSWVWNRFAILKT
jgi:hypothetical protein